MFELKAITNSVRRNYAARSWTAPAERSGDGAFANAAGVRVMKALGVRKSGVALRLPPQSKTLSGVLWIVTQARFILAVVFIGSTSTPAHA
jgi:hypothetical protein